MPNIKLNEFNRMDLNFENTTIAFSYKKTNELKASKWIFTVLKYPILNKLCIKIALFFLKIKFPIDSILKKTIFKQFVGGETLVEAGYLTDKLKQYNINIIFDYGVEGKQSEQCFDETMYKLMKVIDFAKTKSNTPFISIKISALASTALLKVLNDEPRLRSGLHDNEDQMLVFNKVKDRLYRITELASRNNISILIDAEESWIQDPIDRLAIELMEVYNTKKPVVYNTYQLYRTDRLHFLKINHSIAVHNNFILGAKIVRGAYMEKERARADRKNYISPIHIDKDSVDIDFDSAVDYCLMNIDTTAIIVASHNEESILKTTQLMDLYQISHKSNRVWFSQLYGMGDHISFNLADADYQVAKYLPFGPLKEIMPYLIRRANENSSVSKQSNRELNLIKQELIKRKL